MDGTSSTRCSAKCPRANELTGPVLTDYRKAIDEVVRGRIGVAGSFPTLQNGPDLGLIQ